MLRVGVYILPKDLMRWFRALSRVEAEAVRQKENLPRLSSILYSQLVIRNIMSQKGMNYAPYSPRYAKWKEQYGRAHGFWQLYGDLVRNITHFRVTTDTPGTVAFMGGIPSNVVDTGGKSWLGRGDKGPSKPIAMYGRIMEYGGSFGKGGVHPPRPIFGPTGKEYARKEWPDRGLKSLRALMGKWR